MQKRHIIWSGFIIVGIIIILGLYTVTRSHSAQKQQIAPPKKPALSTTCARDLLNPSFCSEKRKIHFINEAALEHQLRAYINEKKSDKSIIRASVFYRDLQNGPVVNIDADGKYYAGSLLKVPVMILYLKYAEKDKTILDRQVGIGADIVSSQLKDSTQTAVRGKTYTVRDLIEKMIIYSDNSSKDALRQYAPDILGHDASVSAVLKEIGVQDPAEETGLLSLKEYASIFRTLYNAQYLSPEMSQLALSILSRSDYKRGMAAGVPKGTVVANKFGIPSTNLSTNPQLHDCGIIYHRVSPYLLCVFTEGKDYFALEHVITQISKDVYTAVDSAY